MGARRGARTSHRQFCVAPRSRIPRLPRPADGGRPVFANGIPREYAPAAQWVRPGLVIEVEFIEVTKTEGRLRRASVKGVRTDCDSRSIVREEPAT